MLNVYRDCQIHLLSISRKKHTKNLLQIKNWYGNAKEIYVPFSTAGKYIYSHDLLGQHEYVQTASASLEAEK